MAKLLIYLKKNILINEANEQQDPFIGSIAQVIYNLRNSEEFTGS